MEGWTDAEELSKARSRPRGTCKLPRNLRQYTLDNLTVLRPTQRLARLKPGKFKRESHDCEERTHMGAFLLP